MHRQRHLALNLPRFGWQPVVLTAPNHRYERDLDWTLFNQLPPEVEIHRVLTMPERPIRIGDLSVRVLPGMLWKAFALCRRRDIDLTFCTGGPWFSFTVGPVLKRRFGIPYILDYQDPWVYEPKGWTPPRLTSRSGLMRKAMAWLEPHVLPQASRVVAVSPGTHEILKHQYPWLDESRFVTLPIGVERTDFQLLEQEDEIPPMIQFEPNRFQVVYTGAVWYGGWPAIKTFLEALKEVIKEGEDWSEHLRVHFIGTGLHKDTRKNGWVGDYAKQLGLHDRIRETCKSQLFLHAVSAMLRADVLLLFGSPERYYMASKLFPYLQTGKPVFAIIYDKSPMRSFLESCDNTEVVTYGEEEPVEQKVREVARRFRTFVTNQLRDRRPNRCPALEDYTAESLAEKLAALFNRVIAE